MPTIAKSVAIVGLGGRFSGAPSIEALWRNLGSEAGPVSSRRFLECATEAIHEAGSAGRGDAGRIGLFTGVPAAEGSPAGSGGDGNSPAAGMACEMGLRGPAVTVPSLSSPALAAVVRACQSLRRAECDLALAGEVSIQDPEPSAAGEGAGVVVLKRLPDALLDGDPMLAVIRDFGSGDTAIVLEPPISPVPGESGARGKDQGTAQPLRERPGLANAYTLPSNRLEAAIAGIWQEYLGLDQIGVHDNFFELGGTSVVGIRIIAVLKEWLRQEIPTVSLYEGPTVSTLARVILQGDEEISSSCDAVRERGERRRRKLQRLAGAKQDPAG